MTLLAVRLVRIAAWPLKAAAWVLLVAAFMLTPESRSDTLRRWLDREFLP